MKLALIFLTFCLFLSSAFAGEMKKIDQVTRETVAQQYYNGVDEAGYEEFIYYEVMNLNLEEDTTGKCLVIVTGNATNFYTPAKDMYKFWVCITRNEKGDYFGKFLKDELEKI